MVTQKSVTYKVASAAFESAGYIVVDWARSTNRAPIVTQGHTRIGVVVREGATFGKASAGMVVLHTPVWGRLAQATEKLASEIRASVYTGKYDTTYKAFSFATQKGVVAFAKQVASALASKPLTEIEIGKGTETETGYNLTARLARSPK